MYGLVGPAGLPESVSRPLGVAIEAALRSPELASRFDQFAGVPLPGSSAVFSAYVRSELERWLPVIKRGNITLE